MPDVSVLEVLLHGTAIGTITRFADDRTLFAFNEAYIEDRQRPTLGLGFKDAHGQLIIDQQPTRVRLLPWFSNLLPEGHMRTYLAQRADIHPNREFFLLWALGKDLPGAIGVRPPMDTPGRPLTAVVLLLLMMIVTITAVTMHFGSHWPGSSSNSPPSAKPRAA